MAILDCAVGRFIPKYLLHSPQMTFGEYNPGPTEISPEVNLSATLNGKMGDIFSPSCWCANGVGGLEGHPLSWAGLTAYLSEAAWRDGGGGGGGDLSPLNPIPIPMLPFLYPHVVRSRSKRCWCVTIESFFFFLLSSSPGYGVWKQDQGVLHPGQDLPLFCDSEGHRRARRPWGVHDPAGLCALHHPQREAAWEWVPVPVRWYIYIYDKTTLYVSPKRRSGLPASNDQRKSNKSKGTQIRIWRQIERTNNVDKMNILI